MGSNEGKTYLRECVTCDNEISLENEIVGFLTGQNKEGQNLLKKICIKCGEPSYSSNKNNWECPHCSENLDVVPALRNLGNDREENRFKKFSNSELKMFCLAKILKQLSHSVEDDKLIEELILRSLEK